MRPEEFDSLVLDRDSHQEGLRRGDLRALVQPYGLESCADPDRIVIYPSRAKLALVVLGSIAFMAIGVWIGVARGSPSWVVVVVSYIGVPFFAACGIYGAYRLAIRRPALEIDSTGITDTSSALCAGRLSWDEVDHVVIYKCLHHWMLGIVPRSLDSFLNRQFVVRRLGFKANLALGCPPINVPQIGLNMKLGDLARLLHTRYGVRVEIDF